MPGTLKRLVSQIRSKPGGNDGLTDAELGATPFKKDGGMLGDLLSQASKGNLTNDAKAALEAFHTMSSGEPIDDRGGLLEKGVSLLQTLPPNSHFGQNVADKMIGMLWRDLPHPPPNLAGENYRSGDGLNNALFNPEMGKAGTPYAKNVPSLTPQPVNLPDPNLVFELLLKRTGPFRPHPAGLSSFFVAFATVVIHECFQTNRYDQNINDTSSYVELSTLYGNNNEETAKIRTFDGQGTLLPDSIASERIMLMPPTVIALVVLFSRNHNHIAGRLLAINEGGKYNKDATKLTPEQLKQQDEDIFQLARNVNVAHFAQCVLTDYVSAILNTPRADSSWFLNLGAEIKNADGSRLERGTGNVCSTEFNVLYRWHAAISKGDVDWTNLAFSKMGKDPENLTPQDFWKMADATVTELRSKSPSKWLIPGLQRGPDGKYADDDLANLLKNAVEDPAHAIGARGSPAALKVIEVMGMMQARNKWKCCTLNNFRRYLNLKPHENFLDWNSDPEIAKAAEQLYGHIECLELYPGLHAEETKRAQPGSGVCPPQTVGRAILDDAVALIRADRFLTHGLDISSLTSWGMASLTPAAGAYGGFLPKVVYTALPNAFNYRSTYALLPFWTPAASRQMLTNNGKIALYDVARKPSIEMVSITSFDACKAAFDNTDTFRTLYNNSIVEITDGQPFFIGFDSHTQHDSVAGDFLKAFMTIGDQKVQGKLVQQPTFDEATSLFFEGTIDRLIKTHSHETSVGGKTMQIDIVRDVLNQAPVEYVSHKFGIPLKTKNNPHGLLTTRELFGGALACFILSSFDQVQGAGFGLREVAKPVAKLLCSVIKFRFGTKSGASDWIQDFLSKGTAYEDSPESEAYYRAAGAVQALTVEQRVGHTLGIMLPIVGNLTQQAAYLVDFYLNEDHSPERKRIIELSSKPYDLKGDIELLGFIREGLRLAPVVIGLPRLVAQDVTVIDGDRKLELKAGSKIIIGTSKAHLDPKNFPNPLKINPHRPRDAYIILGAGVHYCFGAKLFEVQMVQTIKSIFKLRNLRRAPGPCGKLSPIITDIAGLDGKTYLDEACREIPAPQFLHVLYDKE